MARGPSKEQLLDMVMKAASPVAASFNLEIWGLELGGAGRPMVRVYVDAIPCSDAAAVTAQEGPASSPDTEFAEDGQGGVTIGQCAEISRLVGLALEVEDLFPDAWVLEVSSPGLERSFFRLEQLVPYVGREIDTVLWEPHPDFGLRRKFRGTLKSVSSSGPADEGEFVLTPDDADCDVTIPWQGVRKARLIHTFPDTSKPGSGKDAGSKEPKPKKAARGGGDPS